jgi:NADPH-dependent 2,4-dienoyl-CoA reductase/sulfur reductase-like enzyme
MKLLIVGGVAGGASAAARARRLSEEAHIVLFERGPDVSFANCGLPYYVGGEIADRSKLLVTTPERLHARFKLDVRPRTSVEAIDRLVRISESRRRLVRERIAPPAQKVSPVDELRARRAARVADRTSAAQA